MRKHSIWLTGVILLTVVAFLAVFQPITLSPRQNPADASKYLRPVGTPKSTFDAESPNQKATFGNKFYLYKPQHDLDLGLDLQGGMRVVLEIKNRGEFTYTLETPLQHNSEIASQKSKLTDAVKEALGKDVDAQVELSGEAAEITTDAATRLEAKDHLIKLTSAMNEVFGADQFDAPKEKDVFKEVDTELQESVRSIMEKRVNPEGTKEVTSYAKGTNQVVLEIPGEREPDRIRELLRTTAEMNFMLLSQEISVSQDEDGEVTLSTASGPITDEEGLKSAVLVARGRELSPKSSVQYDQSGKPAIGFSMRTKESQDRFAAVTGANMNRYLAIVLDGKVISAPTIQARIHGDGIITGDFTLEEAQDMATLLNAGALPVDVDIVENRTVSATLGKDSIDMSMKAGIIGLLAVLVFMVAYYRLPGIMASIALGIYLFLSLAVLKFFGSTLTLPGIAGIIVSIGMAVDANVIIFERLKEELRTAKPLETAIDVAFARAWTAILDSNVASLITGAVLYWLGTGAVQGFAVTLLIGVAVSMFTAITVTRLFMKLMIRTKAGHKLAWYGV